MTITKSQESLFKTEVVASFVEVCYFGGFDYNEVFELASFITGEDINMSHIWNYRNIIMDELKKDYPELERHVFAANGDWLNKRDMNYYLNYYKSTYGDYMLIKPIKKIPVKVLTDK